MKRSNKIINTQDLEVKLFNKSYALITPDGNLGYFGLFLRDIIDIIDDTSAVNPDDLRPHGRWIQISKARYYDESDRYICSICGSIDENGEQDFEVTTPPYCEYCGAKMDGKEN